MLGDPGADFFKIRGEGLFLRRAGLEKVGEIFDRRGMDFEVLVEDVEAGLAMVAPGIAPEAVGKFGFEVLVGVGRLGAGEARVLVVGAEVGGSF